MMSLAGRVAVVTGAARGLGRAIALRLAADGAAVAAWVLRMDAAEDTTWEIRAAGGRAMACGSDAAKAADIAAAAAETRAVLGPVTILVNNAALSPFRRFEEISEEAWDALMAVNLKGPFLCCQVAIPDMLAAGWGRIVNISPSPAGTGSARQTHLPRRRAA